MASQLILLMPMDAGPARMALQTLLSQLPPEVLAGFSGEPDFLHVLTWGPDERLTPVASPSEGVSGTSKRSRGAGNVSSKGPGVSFPWRSVDDGADEIPCLVILWLEAEPGRWPLKLISRLKARWSQSPFLALGPGVATESTAKAALARVPELTWISLSAQNPPLSHLLNRLLSAQYPSPTDAPLGIQTPEREALNSARILGPTSDMTQSEGPPTLSEHLSTGPEPLSLLASETVVVARPAGAQLTPFAWQSPRAPQVPVPPGSLEEALTSRLAAKPPRLQLLPQPLFLRPTQLNALLDTLIRLRQEGLGQHTELLLSLTQPPDSTETERLRQAGVTSVTLTHPWVETSVEGVRLLPDQRSDAPFTRRQLRPLLDNGLQVLLHLPLGRPDDTAAELKKLLEHYAGIPGVLLKPVPLQLFPGHPLRGEQTETPMSKLTWAEHDDRAVVSTPHLNAPELEALLQLGRSLELLMGCFPATMRQLARTLEWTLLTTVERLGLSGPSAAHQLRDRLDRLGHRWLEQVGLSDYFPQLDALLAYEAFLLPNHQPLHPSRAVTLTDAPLETQGRAVMAWHPAVSMQHFPYDMIQLSQRTQFVPTPQRGYAHLMRRVGLRPPFVSLISERQRRLLERVDGRKTLAELYEELEQTPLRRQEGVDNAQGEGFEALLERDWIYARGLRTIKQTGRERSRSGSSNNPPRDGDNVLAFRSHKRPFKLVTDGENDA